MMMENDTKKTLTRGDRINIWIRSNFLQGSWNYERIQNGGWVFAMIPALKKFYPEKEEAAVALKRHLEFMQTTPAIVSPILGVTLALEEERANGAPVDDAAIQGLKVGMMGPLAGIGDPVWWYTIRPILGSIAAGLAGTSLNMGVGAALLAPLFFFLSWNIIRLAFMWYTQEMAYKRGSAFTDDIGGGLLKRVTKVSSFLGMFVLGALIERWVSINWAGPNAVVSKIPLSKGAYVDWNHLPAGAKAVQQVINALWSQNPVSGALNSTGTYLTNIKITYLQNVLDSLIPGLTALILLFVCMWLLRRKFSPILIIFGIFIFGILMRWAGLM